MSETTINCITTNHGHVLIFRTGDVGFALHPGMWHYNFTQLLPVVGSRHTIHVPHGVERFSLTCEGTENRHLRTFEAETVYKMLYVVSEGPTWLALNSFGHDGFRVLGHGPTGPWMLFYTGTTWVHQACHAFAFVPSEHLIKGVVRYQGGHTPPYNYEQLFDCTKGRLAQNVEITGRT